MLRVRWGPSPCGRLSRPRSTTAPPPHPGGNGGRCACPGPTGPTGTAGTFPTFTINRSAGSTSSYTPVASPRDNRTAPRGPGRPISHQAPETVPISYRDRAPRQPIAASFGAGDESRGFNHWFGFPTPFCLACPPGPLAAARRYVVGAAPTLRLTSGFGLPPASTGRCGDRRWASHPTRIDGASWRTADLVDDEQRDERQPPQLGVERVVALGVREAGDPLGGGRERDAVAGQRSYRTPSATSRISGACSSESVWSFAPPYTSSAS
jgi:hypothetical protein